MCGGGSPFLPHRLIAQMLAGKDDWPLRLEQFYINLPAVGVAAIIGIAPRGAAPFGIARQAPGDSDRLGEQVRPARVQSFDRTSANAGSFLMRKRLERVGRVVMR